MPLVPHLVVRVADVPPPASDGPTLGRLIAVQRHAQMTRWIFGSDVLAGGLEELDQWEQGRGPSGRRIGLVFLMAGQIFVGHEAPGEISPTTGLGLGSVADWIDAALQAHREGRATVDIDGERFEIKVAKGVVTVASLDWDGTVEAKVGGPLPEFLEGLEEAAITAANLASVSAVAGAPLPGAERLRQAAGQLVDTNEDLDDD